MARVLGTEELFDYCQKYEIKLDSSVEGVLEFHNKKPWTKLIRNSNRHLVSPEGIDLLSQILVYDHQERLSAKDALEHEFFDPVKEFYELREQTEKEYEEKERQKEFEKNYLGLKEEDNREEFREETKLNQEEVIIT